MKLADLPAVILRDGGLYCVEGDAVSFVANLPNTHERSNDGCDFEY